MNIPPANESREEASSDRGQGGGYRPGSRLEDDLNKCEFLISIAARTGMRINRGDVCAVVNARNAIDQDSLTAETTGAFYAAMSRVAETVQYPSPSVSEDMRHCRELISYASQTGKPIENTDVEALSAARAAQREIAWQPETEGLFYKSMSRISQAIAPAVAETVGVEARRGARRSIRIYTWSGCILTVCVLILSCLLFVVKGISTDISGVVEKNDGAALSLHNELQAYTGSIEEANRNGSDQAIELLQNSQAALELKDQLQKFATNNRQLYADVTRTNGIVDFFFTVPRWAIRRIFGDVWESDWGKADNKYYHAGCSKPGSRGGILVDFYGPSFPSYRFTVQSSTEPPDWQCDTSSVRHALEIDLPLFATGEMPATEQPSAKLQRPGNAQFALTAQVPEKARRFIPEDTVNQGFGKIAVYQDIRAMAMYGRDIILSIVGAVTGFLLPILYAWLGACASILRQLRSDTATSMFHPEHSKVANRSHVTTAVIVGIAIGLFSDLLHGGTDTSPLAVAFAAGYASDKFFEFIDRLVDSMFPSDSPRRQKGRRKDAVKGVPEANAGPSNITPP